MFTLTITAATFQRPSCPNRKRHSQLQWTPHDSTPQALVMPCGPHKGLNRVPHAVF